MQPQFRIVLASASERRKTLLARMGLTFDVMPADVDETIPDCMPPEQVAESLARLKAETIAEMLHNRKPSGDSRPTLIIGADTVVAFEHEVIGKPEDRAHAVRILRRLRNTSQRVITGVCLINSLTGKTTVDHETSIVTMADLSDEQIDNYVASGRADDKAGAYAVQEDCDPHVLSIEGSFDNVVGLPTELLDRLIKNSGVRLLR